MRDATWTVVREYKNQCTVEELVRMVIRRNLEDIFAKTKLLIFVKNV
jgi:hypothetical protein